MRSARCCRPLSTNGEISWTAEPVIMNDAGQAITRHHGSVASSECSFALWHRASEGERLVYHKSDPRVWTRVWNQRGKGRHRSVLIPADHAVRTMKRGHHVAISSLTRTPGKLVYVHSVPWVRIPPVRCGARAYEQRRGQSCGLFSFLISL